MIMQQKACTDVITYTMINELKLDLKMVRGENLEDEMATAARAEEEAQMEAMAEWWKVRRFGNARYWKWEGAQIL